MTFDPNEQRDAHGRWTTGGAVERHLIDPRVIDVSGDEWNRKTAERLEKEYAAVRPDIDAIANEGVAKGASVSVVGDEEDEGGAPETWDDLSGSQQEEAEQHYIDSHIDQEKEWAVSNWQDNGDAIYEAKYQLAQDDEFKSEWLSEYIAEREEYGEPPLPFKSGDLLGAINIRAGDSYDDNPEITFDEKYLDKPDTLDTETPTFPGIEPQNGADFLTKDMRESIITSLMNKFNDEAKSKAEDIEPPYYLNEQAKESTQEAWSSMDEAEQFKYAMENVDSLKDAEAVPVRSRSDLAWPAKFDPLNETSGEDYRRTQALAKYIADKRGAQLITERVGNAKWKPRDQFLGSDEDYKKLYEQPDSVGRKKDAAWTERMLKELQSADLKLWSGWKGSSTNAEGRLLQVAASDELGGRIRDAKPVALFRDEKTVADSIETAKFIASVETNSYYTPEPELKAAAQKYLDDNKFSVDDIKQTPELTAEKMNPEGDERSYIRLPDVKIDKNGAASTTVSPDVANGWNGTTNNAPQGINKAESIDYANKTYAAIGGYEGVKAALRAKWETTQYLLDKADIPVVQAYRGITMFHKLKGVSEETQSRIVLRAEVPRTAVVSVPAYGVNVKSEQEVVVVGAAWKGWDAWSGRAPTFEQVPMHAKASTTEDNAKAESARVAKLAAAQEHFAKKEKAMLST